VHPRFRPTSWARSHPFDVDLIQAATLAVLTVSSLFVAENVSGVELREPDVLGVVLALLGTLPLAWRRVRPLATLLVLLVPEAVMAVLGYNSGFVSVAVMVALYTVAAYCTRGPAVVGLVAASTMWLVVVYGDPFPNSSVDIVAVLGLTFAAWAFGRSVGFRRAYTAELETRAERLERGRAADTRAALAEERGRIARELHDVVAHHVSVMTVQAAAAQRTLARDPERSREAMAAVEETGRAALHEMRRIVGVLRGPGEESAVDPAQRGPQPCLAEVDELVGQVREAGLDVDLVVEGPARPLSPGVDLAAYRIVQEALTNTLKHAGPTRSRVLLRYDGAELLIRVVDDGHGLAASLAQDGTRRQGHGLLGMRERVSLYGGRLYAGPRAGGGFEVLARIPLDPARA
jgi:signal transduction histidine kinase